MSSTAYSSVTDIRQSDFTYGSYIIDRPGKYRLVENISFNPNSLYTLKRAINRGDLVGSQQIQAADASMPLLSQFQFGPPIPFRPGGPMDARYDPAAFGIGFFAAIVIQADNVDLDLNGYRIEQSEEHALMQRFFAVIELADQPFIPKQGPANFGERIKAAKNVKIHNGTIGRSSHHGIHGNANVNVAIHDIDFVDFEVAAVAVNGVDGLTMSNINATNRKDVPVLGTFSSAMFIKPYIDDLVRTQSKTTLTVNGITLTATDIQKALRLSINRVHYDLIVMRHQVDERVVINQRRHPEEYALFHNPHGVVDGNSYSFVLNHIGIAVDGFPTRPDGVNRIAARNVSLRNIHVTDQLAFINEIPALKTEKGPAVDPVGAVFQVMNRHPDTEQPITVSNLQVSRARYVGNPVANAQAFVGKAILSGDIGSGRLDVTRLSIDSAIIDWVEQRAGSETLERIGAQWLCNGDSMFHVNKGVIAFKMDSAENVRLINTSVQSIANIGRPGTDLCGNYADTLSHPKATLSGYGGLHTRAYTFSGSHKISVNHARVRGIFSLYGSAEAFSIMTDTDGAKISNAFVDTVMAGLLPSNTYYLSSASASGISVSDNASNVTLMNSCVTRVLGLDGSYSVRDESYQAGTLGVTASNHCQTYSHVDTKTNIPVPMVSYRVDYRHRDAIMKIPSNRIKALMTRVYNCRASRIEQRISGNTQRYNRTCVQIAARYIADRDLRWAKRRLREFDTIHRI